MDRPNYIKNDNRKHYTQMAKEEIHALLKAVKSRNYSIVPHALDRMREKGVQPEQITTMFQNGTIIEAHENIPGETRVLVRGKVGIDFLCAVVSLTRNKIITLYWNNNGDDHHTLDGSIYKLKRDFSSVT
jgi:hypothetical protein